MYYSPNQEQISDGHNQIVTIKLLDSVSKLSKNMDSIKYFKVSVTRINTIAKCSNDQNDLLELIRKE